MLALHEYHRARRDFEEALRRGLTQEAGEHGREMERAARRSVNLKNDEATQGMLIECGWCLGRLDAARRRAS